MTLELLTPPAAEPVDMTLVRLHLRIDAEGSPASHYEDALVAQHIAAARELAEEFTGRRLITQTWRLSLDVLPSETVLPFAPVQTVDAVRYVDADNVLQTLAADQYALDKGPPAWLLPAYNSIWPAPLAVANAVRIDFTAGYGAASTSIPPSITQALLLLVGEFYAGREPKADDEDSLPKAVLRCLALHRIWIPRQ